MLSRTAWRRQKSGTGHCSRSMTSCTTQHWQRRPSWSQHRRRYGVKLRKGHCITEGAQQEHCTVLWQQCSSWVGTAASGISPVGWAVCSSVQHQLELSSLCKALVPEAANPAHTVCCSLLRHAISGRSCWRTWPPSPTRQQHCSPRLTAGMRK